MSKEFIAPVDVALKINDETRLVCTMAAGMLNAGASPKFAMEHAFVMLDDIIAEQEERLGRRLAAEAKRRRGY